MVDPDMLSDTALAKLTFDLARKIEQELDLARPVKVSVVREFEANAFAQSQRPPQK